MAFERNDIVVKTKLADALGDELMGFEHNDIVTTDVMNAAIAGGGGGGIPSAGLTINWKLSGIQPSAVSLIEFTGILAKNGDDYNAPVISNPETSEGEIVGMSVPLINSDNEAHWFVAVTAYDTDENECTVTLSDLTNCTDVGGGGASITDNLSPSSLTATIAAGV